MRRLILLTVLFLVGCATSGGYRQPAYGGCALGKKATRGNCGLSPQYQQPEQGNPCSSDYNCALGQFCRKANAYDLNGVCVNRGL